jgi:predicted DNA-binding transcriptional regulator AlpA
MTDSPSASTAWQSDTELAAELGVTPDQLNAAAKRGEFPKPLKIGRAVRYNRAAVAAWLSAQSAPAIGGQK